MKATPSKDGEMRFTVRIPQRIGLQEMVDGLGWTLMRGETDWFAANNKAMAVEAALKEFSSRKAIMDATTRAISSKGDDVWVWSDDCSFREIICEQAKALILNKYPELRPVRKAVEL